MERSAPAQLAVMDVTTLRPSRVLSLAALALVLSLAGGSTASCGDDGASTNSPAGDDSALTGSGGTDDAAAAGDAGPAGDAQVWADGDVSGGDGADEPPLPTEAGCGATTLLERPADPGARGPWPVGARTVDIAGRTVEVWYPAAPGSAEGAEPRVYDIRPSLPTSQVDIIPDADNPWLPCDCSADLPLDTERGPYPVVVFVHGTASFRMQSLSQMTHWASRGFVVVAADHPGLKLGDLLALACPGDVASGERDLGADVDAMLAALTTPADDIAFLGGHIDMTRVGISGHSAGGAATAELADRAGVRVAIPMSSSTPIAEGSQAELALFLGGTADAIVEPEATTQGYEESTGFDRELGLLEGAAHLTFSDICTLENEAGEDLLTVASAYDICGFEFASALVDCAAASLDHQRGIAIVNHLSTLALERTLQCADRATAWASVADDIPELSTWRSDPAAE